MNEQYEGELVRTMFGEPSAEVDELARAVIGAAIEVHRHLGPGLVESAYQRALEHELLRRELPFEAQLSIDVLYKGVVVCAHRLDLVVGGRLLVELKAVDGLAPVHIGQVLGYLATTGHELALLLNFGAATLKDGIKRVRPRRAPRP